MEQKFEKNWQCACKVQKAEGSSLTFSVQKIILIAKFIMESRFDSAKPSYFLSLQLDLEVSDGCDFSIKRTGNSVFGSKSAS